MPNGYDAIVSGLINRTSTLTIYYNTIVSKIDYSFSDRIEVTTDSRGVLKASKVVVTVPIGVLKAGTISFNPAWPTAKTNSLAALGAGAVNKVAMIFPSQFWGNLGFFGFNAGQGTQRGYFNYYVNAKLWSGANALVTFGLGQAAVDIESWTNQQISDAVMVNLRKMFGANIPNATQVLVTRWLSDPFAKVSYTYAKVGSKTQDFDNMASQIGYSVFFAGEHCSSKYRGTVHGAYLTGVTAANAVIAATNKIISMNSAAVASGNILLLVIVAILAMLLA